MTFFDWRRDGRLAHVCDDDDIIEFCARESVCARAYDGGRVRRQSVPLPLNGNSCVAEGSKEPLISFCVHRLFAGHD